MVFATNHRFYSLSFSAAHKHEYERLVLVSSHGCPQNWFFYLRSFHLWWPGRDIISFSITPSILSRLRGSSRLTSCLKSAASSCPSVTCLLHNNTLKEAWPSLRDLCNYWSLDNVKSEKYTVKKSLLSPSAFKKKRQTTEGHMRPPRWQNAAVSHQTSW